MLPTLYGRIQSRIFFLATIGSLWTFVMASILPATFDLGAGVERSADWGERLQDGFVALLWVAVLGVGWELIYHFLMQWRWEKDWPTFFGFITFLPEGVLVYLLSNEGVLPGYVGREQLSDQDIGVTPFWFFWPLFVVVWMAVWVWTNGPMRVVNIHWRFFGGKLAWSVLQPVGGDGVLSREGTLIVLCAAGVRTDAVLSAHAEVAASGGDGTALADRLGELLTDGTVDAVAFGPSGATTTVAVFGHAWADVTTVHGEQRLALKEAAEGVRSSLAGTVLSIRAGLGDVEAAAEPQRWGDLRTGTVHARGLLFVPAETAAAPPPVVTEPVAETIVSAEAAREIAELAAVIEAEDAVPVPRDATLAPPPEPPPAAPVAQPEVFAPPQIDRSQPFSSVVFVKTSGSAPQVEERAPLPVIDMPLPPPTPDAAPAPHPTEGVSVLGVYCKNGHFDDPSARYCAICGISMAQLTLVPRPGPRPPLGVLVLDDGSIFSLDADYVIGRNPARVDDVASGQARALRLDDRQGLLSRAHARVRLDGWLVQIVDLGSVNGTGVMVPGTPGWQRLPANTPVAIRPGTEVGVGQRRLRYESHRNT